MIINKKNTTTNRRRVRMMTNNKELLTTLQIGVLLGTILPYIGIATGLILSPVMGSILCLPQILMSSILEAPFANFTIAQRVLSLLISIVFWSAITFIYRSLRWRHIKH
jgi:ABC-type dipeptide/oligopeptide/nickel transport system permease subunit